MEKAILLRVGIYLICYFECNCNESFSHDTNNGLNHVWMKQEQDVVGSLSSPVTARLDVF